ncbi:MAG TPA: aminoacyl-tRNA hydrolase [Bacteroidota bacterium]|nr:aminoacyl-tRNA hydrolase [Bacteroidota bacterium]
MFALFGLGNPGAEYAGTRHNAGFMVLDAIASATAGTRFKTGHGPCLMTERTIGASAVLLVKPLTYMNNSGAAVADILERYGIGIGETLTITDDVHLLLGSVRLRRGGSHGGHNGLRSIIDTLGTTEFPRMRCGIGPRPERSEDLPDFVLSPFRRGEAGTLAGMIERARDAALTAVRETLPEAMARFNG